MTLHEALECQDFINDYLLREFSSIFDKWGVEVTRIELLHISPGSADRNVLQAMRMQLVAERKRRGDFIRNEGEKVAQNLLADAKKIITRIEGISEQEATKRISEGRASSTVLLAQAERSSLDAITHITTLDNISYTDFFLTKQFISMIGSVAKSSSSNHLILPFEPFMFSGPLATSAPRTFGRFGSIANALSLLKPAEPVLTKDQVFNVPSDVQTGSAPTSPGVSDASAILSQLTMGQPTEEKKFSDLD